VEISALEKHKSELVTNVEKARKELEQEKEVCTGEILIITKHVKLKFDL